MKRSSALVLALICLLAGRFSGYLTADAQGGFRLKGVSMCGNVNGDEELNIADPIYLLMYLFSGGPAPVCSDPAPAPVCSPLPRTGQTLCYDTAGSEIGCDDPDYPGQDAYYQAGCGGEDRFVDNQDGTVTDTCTRLIWQIRTADTNGDGEVTAPDKVTWQEALKYCEELEFAGCNDWRLPNYTELSSIADNERVIDPVFDRVSRADEDAYWSSTTYGLDAARAITWIFSSVAYPWSYEKWKLYYVLAVRDASDCP